MSLQDHVGRTETATDMVWPPLVSGMAATLGASDPGPMLLARSRDLTGAACMAAEASA